MSPEGRKGSFIGARRLAREEPLVPGADPPPTNEAVAQAVQEKVAVGTSCHSQCASNFVVGSSAVCLPVAQQSHTRILSNLASVHEIHALRFSMQSSFCSLKT